MSSRRVKTRKDVLKQLYDSKFENLSEDIQEIIEKIIQKQEEEDAKKEEDAEYSNDSLLIKTNIRSKKTNINNKNIYNNTNGGRPNNMSMKDLKYMCKANQIKLSRVVNGMRIVYTKKELITKLKRKKII
jgi:TRAP-type C4-dicarboxylate transport system substrate-binding protein